MKLYYEDLAEEMAAAVQTGWAAHYGPDHPMIFCDRSLVGVPQSDVPEVEEPDDDEEWKELVIEVSEAEVSAHQISPMDRPSGRYFALNASLVDEIISRR